MAWTTLPVFKNYVGSEITIDDAELQSALTAAENGVRAHCNRDFTLVAAGSVARSYSPVGDMVLTHDIADSTGITITDNAVAIAATDYQLEPVNEIAPDGSYRPYSTIRRTVGTWYQPANVHLVTVDVTTARWGWLTVDQTVVEATMILGKDLAHLRTNRFGVAGFGDFGVVRVRDNPHVVKMLEPFSLHRHGMA